MKEMEVDPTIYDYDAVYDDIQKERGREIARKDPKVEILLTLHSPHSYFDCFINPIEK